MTTWLLTLPLCVLLCVWVQPHPIVVTAGMWVAAGVATANLFDPTLKYTVVVPNFLVTTNHIIQLGVWVDEYTAYMVWVVYVVSALVHTYAGVYMRADPRCVLFMCYLTLFTFFMVLLLVSPNYVQLFMGWEGVGLTSYLLVNFWHTRTAANKSALKALLVNRVGDVFFLWALLEVVLHHGTLFFVNLACEVHPGTPWWLLAAVAAKSAQLGLHTWLPDAMEGPTPVSALIHAATMVTAGLFLLFRSTHLMEVVRPFVVHLGAMTAFFAGTVAAFQFDLKRVIAYSTCSQLGYMMVAYGCGGPELSLYHLGNHAFFKALLFLLAGLVIHALDNQQDMRRMGGLAQVLPVTYVLFVVGTAALVGVPFLSGYYSKDPILEILYSGGWWFGYTLCLMAAYLTAYYSCRTLVLVFYGAPRGGRTVYLTAAEADNTSLWCVCVLGFVSLFHGWLTKDYFFGWGRSTGWATPLVSAEFVTPLWVKLLPLFTATIAVVLALAGPLLPLSRGWWLFVSKRWWWDTVDATVARRALVKGYYLYLGIERGCLEMVGPTGVRHVLSWWYDLTRNRGWFSFFWLAVVASLWGLALFSSTSQTCPFIPFVVLHYQNKSC